METKEFENLLSDYLDGRISEDCLEKLHEAIKKHPQLRRRFQREMRIHTLLYETVQEQNEHKRLLPRPGITHLSGVIRTHWKLFSSIAACLIAGVSVLLYFSVVSGIRKNIAGYCLHVSGRDDMLLLRDGREIIAKMGTAIHWDDTVQTSSDAHALLELKQVGILSLEGAGRMLFRETGKTGHEIFLKHGSVLFDVIKRDPTKDPLIVKTEDATMNILGTVFSLEALPTATRVKVYEGLVDFHENKSQDSVYVAAEQYSVTGQDVLKTGDLASLASDGLLPSQIRVFPSDDVYMEKGKIYNTDFLKVEGSGKRVIFLKFTIEDVGEIVGAQLRLKQTIDPGSGTMLFWEGSHSNWTEDTMSQENAPVAGRRISQRKGLVQPNQTISVDVRSLIQGSGRYTLIITQRERGHNDVWFGSRESESKPELILTCRLKDEGVTVSEP